MTGGSDAREIRDEGWGGGVVGWWEEKGEQRLSDPNTQFHSAVMRKGAHAVCAPLMAVVMDRLLADCYGQLVLSLLRT